MSLVPNRSSDLVLVDSDSDVGYKQSLISESPPKKKLKLETGGFQVTANDTTDDSEEAGQHGAYLRHDEREALLACSEEKVPSIEMESMTQQSTYAEGDSCLKSDDSSLESVLPDDLNESEDESTVISRQVIAETRKYLKENGSLQFLDKYLPLTASSEDLLELIFKLGFCPRDIPRFQDNDRLLGLIKLLHTAMKKVSSMRDRLLNFYDVEHVLDKLQSASKILVITGAGISTSLGIPDFRSSQGFYSKLEHLGLSDPQEVFELDFFNSDPSIFYLIAHMILPPDNTYTPMHAFIKLLQEKGKLLRNYTQNIDNLEENAGIDPEKIVQCHGSFAGATCVTCGYKVKGDEIFGSIRKKEIPLCPKCYKTRKRLMGGDDYIPESFGVMKPDITFFGEPLPSRFHDYIRQDLYDCDLVLAVGTSLKVAPVADIVESIPREIPQVLINKDLITHCTFDISLLGYCDEVASYLCSKLPDDWKLICPKDMPAIDSQKLKIQLMSENEGVYRISNSIENKEVKAINEEEDTVSDGEDS